MNTTPAELEIHSKESNNKSKEWQSVCQVQLLDEKKTPSCQPKPGREQLPLDAKRFLCYGPTPLPGRRKDRRRQDYYLYSHAPNGKPNTNLLVLLHGAGDSHRPFHKLGKTMALPQTATLSIAAETLGCALPLGLGYTWFHEMDYQQMMETANNNAVTNAPPLYLSHDNPLYQSSLQRAVLYLTTLLEILLGRKNSINEDDEGWIQTAERIFLLGFGAGATVVMETCAAWSLKNAKAAASNGTKARLFPPLGGAICIGGGGISTTESTMIPLTTTTPLLLMVGGEDSKASSELSNHFSLARAKKLQRRYGNSAELYVQEKQGMVSTPRDMKRVMEFLSTKLVQVNQFGM